MLTLPTEYVDTHVSYFEKQGMKPERDVIEEILYNIAHDGIESPDYIRYYTLGNKEEKEVFEHIESASVDKDEIWEKDIEVNGDYYRIACSY